MGDGPRTGTVPGSLRPDLQVVGEVREDVAPALGDDAEILEADAAEALAVDARLDRDDVADHQVVAGEAHVRGLVHLDADAVAEPVEEVLIEGLTVCQPAGRAVAAGLDRVAGRLPDRRAVDPG